MEQKNLLSKSVKHGLSMGVSDLAIELAACPPAGKLRHATENWQTITRAVATSPVSQVDPPFPGE